jgi:hypothetical protein
MKRRGRCLVRLQGPSPECALSLSKCGVPFDKLRDHS